jgi:hypothetical protein
MHLEIDRYPEDGIDLEGLRPEWDAFWHHGNAAALATLVRERLAQREASGAVLSFPGGVVPTEVHISAALAERITLVVLYGSGAECLDAFLSRERASGRNLTVDHWIGNNASPYAAFSAPLFSPYRLNVFADGRFRDIRSLITEVRKRAG